MERDPCALWQRVTATPHSTGMGVLTFLME
jgi:hypothetical protein